VHGLGHMARRHHAVDPGGLGINRAIVIHAHVLLASKASGCIFSAAPRLVRRAARHEGEPLAERVPRAHDGVGVAAVVVASAVVVSVTATRQKRAGVGPRAGRERAAVVTVAVDPSHAVGAELGFRGARRRCGGPSGGGAGRERAAVVTVAVHPSEPVGAELGFRETGRRLGLRAGKPRAAVREVALLDRAIRAPLQARGASDGPAAASSDREPSAGVDAKVVWQAVCELQASKNGSFKLSGLR